jgi:uncharacterized protein (TIGR02449 family)
VQLCYTAARCGYGRPITAARAMTDSELKQLETRIEDLLVAYRRLKTTNRTLDAEWQAMVKKNTELRHRLEAVITRMRAIEQQAEQTV